MKFDLNRLAARLAAAANRSEGLEVSVSNFDLILSRDGYGTYGSQTVPFAALFLSEEDVLGKALDRLGVEATGGAAREPKPQG